MILMPAKPPVTAKQAADAIAIELAAAGAVRSTFTQGDEAPSLNQVQREYTAIGGQGMVRAAANPAYTLWWTETNRLSPEGRERVAAAVRKRWKKQKPKMPAGRKSNGTVEIGDA